MNPIIRREFFGLLRTRAAFGAQAVFVLAICGAVMLRWPGDGEVSLGGDQAHQALAWFGYGLMAAMVLIIPAFAANAIVSERRQGTLALLLNSPLSPAAIFAGKLAGLEGFVLLILILSLPAAAACYAMGGIQLDQLTGIYCLLVLLSLQIVCMSLYISTRARTVDFALRLAYAAVFGLVVLPLGSGFWGINFRWVTSISPVPAMMKLLGNAGAIGLPEDDGAFFSYAVLASVSAAALAALTIHGLGQRMLDQSRSAGKVTDEQSRAFQFYRRIMYLWFFDPQRRGGGIRWFTNPVMAKEDLCSSFGRSHRMVRLAGACLVVSLGLMIATARGTEDWGVAKLGAIMVVMQVLLIVLLVPSLAAGLISSEIESGGWQLLKMTPLSPLTIVMGKLLSVFRILLLLLTATLPGYGVMLLIDQDQWPRAERVLITLLLTTVFAVIFSATVSSLLRRTTQAIITSYAVLVGLFAGTLLVWVARDSPFTQQSVERALMLNPMAVALSAIAAPGFEQYRLIPVSWCILGGVSLLMFAILTVRTWQLSRAR